MTTTLRIDDILKRDCDDVFGRLGISMSSAITVFLKQVVRTQRIPFEISCAEYIGNRNIAEQQRTLRRREALAALEAIRRDRIVRDEKEWTLDEINAEISAARSGRIRKSSAGARK